MTPDGELRRSRIGRNEANFRAINERLAQDLKRVPDAPRLLEFVCECGDRSCDDTVSLTLAEYEAIRRDSRRFAVVTGHVFSEVERVVLGNRRYQVVEKVGTAAEVTDAADQRSAGAEGLRSPRADPPPEA